MLKHLVCALLDHRYITERTIAAHWRKVGCTRCERSWSMHDRTRTFTPWDSTCEQLAKHYEPGGILCEVHTARPGSIAMLFPGESFTPAPAPVKSFEPAEISAIKSFLASAEDVYRPSFDRDENSSCRREPDAEPPALGSGAGGDYAGGGASARWGDNTNNNDGT